jgi:hypothetical protein
VLLPALIAWRAKEPEAPVEGEAKR